MLKRVRPIYIECWDIPIWNSIFGIKARYKCGNCWHVQTKKVPMVDYPTAVCEYCNALNEFPLVIQQSILGGKWNDQED